MNFKHLSAALLLSPLLFSCKKNAGNEDASSFSYRLKTSNSTTALGRVAATDRTTAASVQWTAGTAFATQLKFEAKNSSGEIEFKQNVQQQIDLFATTSVLGNLTVPQGTYSEVEFKAFLSPAGSAQALMLNGTITSSGTTTPVSFRVNESIELKAEKANVTVAAGTTYAALNTLDLSQLTRGISEADFASATRTGGVIIIAANSNANLYSTMLSNLNKHHGEAEIEHD